MQHEITVPSITQYCVDEYAELRVINIIIGFIKSVSLNDKYMAIIKDVFDGIFSDMQLNRTRFSEVIQLIKVDFSAMFDELLSKLLLPHSELFGLDIGEILTDAFMVEIKNIWVDHRPFKKPVVKPKKQHNNATQHNQPNQKSNVLLRGTTVSFRYSVPHGV